MLASVREFLNLEKWLQGQLKTPNDKFIKACIAFAKRRFLPDATTKGVQPPLLMEVQNKKCR